MQRAVNDALTAERNRISQIPLLGTEHGIAAEVVNRCCESGLSIDQARAEFLTLHSAPAAHLAYLRSTYTKARWRERRARAASRDDAQAGHHSR